VATLVFLPVSSAVGTGEFMRCALLAHAVAAARPDVRIVFGVSREASVPEDFPFAVEWLPASPTKSTPEVLALLERERPAAVFWDNSGRAGQFKAARALGARTFFLSVRPATRRKGFKLQRLMHTDELILVDALRPPTPRERVLLRLFRHVHLRTVDALHTPADAESAGRLLAQHAVPDPFVLLVATSFRDRFGDLAVGLAEAGPLPVVCVGGEPTRPPDAAAGARLHVLPLLPNATLMGLVARAALVVSGTGHVAEQVACFAAPLVTVPVTPEQRQRARLLAELGVAEVTPDDGTGAIRVAAAVAADPARREALRAASERRGLRNGLPEIVGALVDTLDTAGTAGRASGAS
jgi:hypothetical protein